MSEAIRCAWVYVLASQAIRYVVIMIVDCKSSSTLRVMNYTTLFGLNWYAIRPEIFIIDDLALSAMI